MSANAVLAQDAAGPVIHVLGGPTAVSDEIVARLEQMTGGRVSRLSGNDRYATAAAVSRAHFASAPAVLVASGESYADSLSAGPAATALGGPILLVTRDGVPPATDAELRRLAPLRVVIAGGPNAVSRTVEARLAALGVTVERVSGPDRYATSAALSRLAAPHGAKSVFLTSGRDFADAMSGAAPAAVHRATILLTDPGSVSPAVRAELLRLKPDEIVVLGGETAVPTRLAERLRAETGIPYRRVAGRDRYVTNTEVSRTFYPRGADVIFLANATRFADAMVVGAVARGGGASGHASPQAHEAGHDTTDGVLLYTHEVELPALVQQELARLETEHREHRQPEQSESPSPSPSPSASPSPNPAPPAPPAPNAPPVIDLNGSAAGSNLTGVTFTEGGAAVSVAPAATVTAPEGGTLTGMTLTLQAAPDGAAESLAASIIPGTITAAPYNVATRTLAFSGSASAADYQAALRAVEYGNVAGNANATDRVVQVTATDGTDTSATRTSTITMSVVNDAPVVDLNGGAGGEDVAVGFTENGAAALIAPAATVSDADHTNLSSATITISNLQDGAAESLAATADLPTGITAGTYNTATGALTLSGSSSVANYQAALRVIGYSNTDDTPTTATARAVTVTVSDGTAGSVSRTSTVSVTAVNDAPVVDLNGTGTAGNDTTASYTEDAAAVAIASGAVLSDADSANLTGATVTITNLQNAAAETLAVSGLAAGINASYDPAGVLSLSGTATVTEYQAAIRAVTYVNSSQTPGTTARAVTVTVTDGAATSAGRTSTVSVTAVNDAPTLGLATTAGTDVSRTFPVGGSAIAIAPAAVVADPDGVVTSMTITIANGRVDGNDETLDLPGTVADITESWNVASGVLTLSGSATPAAYQSALRSVTYHNADAATPTAGARAVTVTVTDGAATTSPRTSTVTVSTNTAPVAADHTYEHDPVFVNVLFVSGGGTPAAEAYTTDSLKLLNGATDAENNTLSVTGLTVTSGGGTATLLDAATGAFSYEPTSSGDKVLTYTISDGSLTDTGTVNITVDADEVVFVKSGATGAGTSTSPLGTLADAQAKAGDGDTIFVTVGDGQPYTGGIALETGQRLIGAPSPLKLTNSGGLVTAVTANTAVKPVIGNAGGAGITMADGSTVDGVAVSQTTQPAISGGAGTATIKNVAVTTTTGNGIDLLPGTYTLDGGITVSTDDGTALEQTSGTISVTGAGNTLSATGGQALNLTGTTVTGGMAFKSVTTSGGANAITFSPRNGDASLTVQGDLSDGSGGTLTGHTGDAVVATGGSVTLEWMHIQANHGRAISATGTSGLVLTSVKVDGNGNAADEHSVQLTNVTGTNSFTNSEFFEGSGDLLHLANTNANATLIVTGSTFEDTDAAGGARGLVVSADGTSAISATVTGSEFTKLAGAGLRFAAGSAGGTGSSTLTFRGNTMTGAAGRPTHLDVLAEGQTTATVMVGGPDAAHANTMASTALPEDGSNDTAGAVQLSATGTATLRGTVRRNTITGSQGHGIFVLTYGDNVARLLVRDNTVTNPFGDGIWIGNSDDGNLGSLDATVLSNNVTGAGTGNVGPIAAIRLEAFDDTVCSDIAGNTAANADNSGELIIDTQNGAAHTYVMTEDAPVDASKVSTRNNGAAVDILNTVPTKHAGAACTLP